MTITQLKYVLAVAEYQNFTKAAERTFVTQPTLSMQIQTLEDELNIKIFDRSKKPIALMPTLLPMFLKTFTVRYPKVQLKIEELTTDEIITQLTEGHLDAAIAATPLDLEHIKERVIYYEPFVGYVPESHRLFQKEQIEREDLEIDDILLLEDGHCFRDGVINLCKVNKLSQGESFQLESGSFETLIKLSHEGLGMTLLPYLHTLDLKESQQKHLRYFPDPSPARSVSLIYHRSELKMQIINALHDVISGVIRGAIAFQDVQIISPTK